MTRRCSCPFCVRPVSQIRSSGLLGRWMTVDASRLYALLDNIAVARDIRRFR